MKKNKKNRFFKAKYLYDFLSMFTAVVLAFALNHWNDNRRDRISEDKILLEIKNGLELDLEDIISNKKSHRATIESYGYIKRVLKDKTVSQDSLTYYYSTLFKEPSFIVNRSGYESLKNKGLEIIQNDSLRVKIIRLYESDYQSIIKFEEQTDNMESYNYYEIINSILIKYYVFTGAGRISFKHPINFTQEEKNELNNAFWRMTRNRYGMYMFYYETEKKVKDLLEDIKQELRETQ